MPGTLTIAAKQTFTTMLLISAAQKMDFDNPDQPDLTKNGEKKFEITVAVTYLAEEGRKPLSEVIAVGIIGGDLPAIMPGTPVEFGTLRCGVSTPQVRGRDRISGGKFWYQGDGLRAVQAPPAPALSRPPAGKPAEHAA